MVPSAGSPFDTTVSLSELAYLVSSGENAKLKASSYGHPVET